MPPRKKPVLFEVVARSQRARKRRSGVAPASPWPQVSGSPANTPTPAPPVTEAQPAAASRAPSSPGRKLLVTLGWPQLLVIAVLLAVVLVATYQAGVRSALPPDNRSESLQGILSGSPDQPSPQRNKPAVQPAHSSPRPVQTPAVRPGEDHALPAPIASPPQQRTAAVVLQEGKYYAVAQYFTQRARQAADAARDYLESRGVPAVVTAGRGDWMVVATQPFESADAARDLVKRIQNIGKDYARTGSGYDFGGCTAREF